MKKIVNSKTSRKLLTLVMVASLVFSLCSVSLAANKPSGNAPTGSMPSGNMQSGNMQSGNDNQPPEMPQNGNSETPPEKPSGTSQGAMDTNREDMTPPDDPDTEPGENVPEKPSDDSTSQLTEPEDLPNETPGVPGQEIPGEEQTLNTINRKALEAYFDQTGDDADSAVKDAYDALMKALEEEPVEGEESNIAELEETLNKALEDAEINIDDYAEDLPEEPGEDFAPDETNDSDEDSEFNQFIHKYWDKLVNFFDSFLSK